MSNDRQNTVHVGLIFHSFQSENLGVGAFTVCNVSMIGKAIEANGGSPVFHVIGARGHLDYSDSVPWPSDFTNVGNKALTLPTSDLHRVIRKCDIFFDIGAGDGYSDLYKTKRLVRSVACKLLAARTGKPLILSPQTIGPFVTKSGTFIGKTGLRASQKIFARDAQSFDVLVKMGLEPRSTLTTDLAFALPFEKPASKKAAEQLAGGGLEIGLNVSGFLFDLAKVGTGRVKLALDYASYTRRLIERLLADERVARLHIVPHVRAPHFPGDDDGAAAAQLAKEYPELVIAPDFESPSAAKSYIAALDLFMGARMHSTIAALSSDTAVLPLAYSRKFNGLYESLEYPYLVDMVNEDEAAAMAGLDRILAELPAASAAAAASNAMAQEKLRVYSDYVDQAIAELMTA